LKDDIYTTVCDGLEERYKRILREKPEKGAFIFSQIHDVPYNEAIKLYNDYNESSEDEEIVMLKYFVFKE